MSWFSDAVDAVSETFSDAVDATVEAAQEFAEDVEEAWDDFQEDASDAWTEFVDDPGITTFIAGVLGTAGAIVDLVFDGVGAVVGFGVAFAGVTTGLVT